MKHFKHRPEKIIERLKGDRMHLLGCNFPRKIDFTINENGCHICTSHRSYYGKTYPLIGVNRKTIRISRYIWEAYNRVKIPVGLVIRHTCDTPSCINPKHLILGTVKDNVRDMMERGRKYIIKGESHHKSKLTERQVRKIKFSSTGLRALAAKFEVSIATVKAIRCGRNWKHVLQ